MNFELEIIATTAQLCRIAENAGATRIELCAGLCEGGTTPSFGVIKSSLKIVNIPVYVMIRPRGGDFFYTADEFAAMQEDIKCCKALGVPGVVFGILNKDGSVDKPGNSILTELAYPMSVTFHRAFDRTINPQQAVEDIISCGFDRILSSGQQPVASKGKNLLKALISQYGNDIIIMPGSGINANNIEDIAKTTGAGEFHLSGRKTVSSNMEYLNPALNEPGVNQSIDADVILQIRKKLEAI